MSFNVGASDYIKQFLMAAISTPEYWLRGPVADIPSLLQPVAHAMLQAKAEVKNAVIHFPEEKRWDKPAGVASVAFHLQHLAGVIDRLFTYAKGEALSQQQLTYLSGEGEQNAAITLASMLDHFVEQVDYALLQLKTFPPAQLTHTRFVGRHQLPSTVVGLLFHAAEHTMRHTGQLLVTTALLKDTASG